MKVKYRLREILDFSILFFFWLLYYRFFSGGPIDSLGWFEVSGFALLEVLVFLFLGIYRTDWQFINFFHTISILIINALFLLVFTGLQYRVSITEESVHKFIFGYFGLSFAVLSNRLFWYYFLNPGNRRKKTGDTSVILYGAGTVAMHLLEDLRTGDLIDRFHISGIIDNNPEKIGSRLGPYKVQDAKKIVWLVDKYKVKEIWLTMPVSTAVVDDLFSKLSDVSVLYKVVPRRFDQIIPDIRGLRIEDLVQRPAIHLSQKPLEGVFKGKRILITGAAGSIGSEIARQLRSFNVGRLVLLDQNERGVYDLEREFGNDKRVVCHIADIRNKKRILEIISAEKPHMIFHAAAYKHVPLMEKNYLEAVETNIFGTHNLLSSAKEYLEKQPSAPALKVINISTDKAVSPENIMGISKRISELLVYNAALKKAAGKKPKKMQTVSVRFGNVLSSSGSVVPLFWEQIQNGGPVTVTHPDMERFFMTVPEAVNLVLHGVLESSDNSILALDMGSPVKILNMAERLILLSGRIPHRDIKIEFTGIRPGEKLKEELFWTTNSVKTNNPYIFKSGEDLKAIQTESMLKKILQAQREKKSLHWWKSFLKQFV